MCSYIAVLSQTIKTWKERDSTTLDMPFEKSEFIPPIIRSILRFDRFKP